MSEEGNLGSKIVGFPRGGKATGAGASVSTVHGNARWAESAWVGVGLGPVDLGSHVERAAFAGYPVHLPLQATPPSCVMDFKTVQEAFAAIST
jgi:hypothetical protein